MVAKLCASCGKKMVKYICRRCGVGVCADCYFHHGLCRRCAKAIGRMQQIHGKKGLSTLTMNMQLKNRQN